jgi:hypothetical protein
MSKRRPERSFSVSSIVMVSKARLARRLDEVRLDEVAYQCQRR